MKLSGELFRHLAESLSNQASDNLPAEHRSETRARLLGRAVIIPCPARCGRRPASVAVRDLSPTGIGVIHDQRLDQGEQFILRLPGERQSTPPALLCTVMHCRFMGPSAYALGACFTGRIEAGQSATAERLDSASVESMTQAFREQATAGLSAAEAEQIREFEARLNSARPA